MTHPADLATVLHALADQVEQLDVAEVVGRLETIRFAIWASAANHAPVAPPVGSSRALDVAAVSELTGMSKDWLYRQARAGQLPFARRLGRRVVFDEAGLKRYLGPLSRARRAGSPQHHHFAFSGGSHGAMSREL
jgi:predicted DNA-binding transcriptional regulator AlpA